MKDKPEPELPASENRRSQCFAHRTFRAILCIVLLGLMSSYLPFFSTGCGSNSGLSSGKKMIILGIDAMDPVILDRLIQEGKMPHFERLRQLGGYKRLETSIPPESPVAWSNFITGLNPGGHGIFDFIHRDPLTMIPFLSTSRTEAGGKELHLGNWVFPLVGGKVTLLRQGRSFWEILKENGIPSTMIRIPANFPPVNVSVTQLSGMGTPDIQGTYGTFSFFTDEPISRYTGMTGGEAFRVQVESNAFKGVIPGPRNVFRKDAPRCGIDFTLFADAEHPLAKIAVQGQQIILKEKEWSDWVSLRFELVPYLQDVRGMCRFYLKEIRPHFRLYVSPVNMDPSAPAMPISQPVSYAAELAGRLGPFYTQGIPEDANALSAGILDDGEFLQQVRLVFDETRKMFDDELNRFRSGLFYFYFGTIDQLQHMFWRTMDPNHPAHDPASPYTKVIDEYYREMDAVLGQTLKKVDGQTTLIVLSDHGFAPFYRAFNLNTWLKNNAYASLLDFSEGNLLQNVDWANTRAYGLGFGGLYLNLKGREKNGIVRPEDRERLLDELKTRLLAVKDPKNGEAVILRVYKTEDVYSGPCAGRAPDLIIGYNRGYRASWETTLGKFPRELLRDNREKWSGDHLIAPELVPGILLANRRIKAEHPALYDLAPGILDEFGVPKEKDMVGNSPF